MLIPCVKSETSCFPCAGDSSNPFANLSIEPFDRNIFVAVHFGTVVNPIPNIWTALACIGICQSSINQQDADDCATRAALACLHVPPIPAPPPQPPPLPPPQVQVICNQAVSCQDGVNCYTVPACTVFSNTQANADAIALSLCNTRVLNPALYFPCPTTPSPPPPSPPGPTITYDMVFNHPLHGEFACEWPADYQLLFPCACEDDQGSPHLWPATGTATDPDTTVTQSGSTVDVSLDCFVQPNTAFRQNESSTERLYLRSRVDGGVSGKHVKMEGHWTFPGGSWLEGSFNEDTQVFDFNLEQSIVQIGFNDGPCDFFTSPATVPLQVNIQDAAPSSGDILYEFDVPPGGIAYACVKFRASNHAFGPSTLHLLTTIT